MILLVMSATLLTNCGYSQTPQKEETVRVFIDPSDKIKGRQKNEVRQEIYAKSNNLSPGSRIILTKIEAPDSSDMDNRDEVILITRPDTTKPYPSMPKDCPTWTKTIKECEMENDAVEKKIKEFEEHLSGSLDSLLNSPEMEYSPIVEALPELPNDMCDSSCHLWIVSDMIQNSTFLSLYKKPIRSFDSLESEIEWDWGFPTEMEGSSVRIWRINRCRSSKEAEIQKSDEYKSFWNDYFTRVTGSKLSEDDWTPVPSGC